MARVSVIGSGTGLVMVKTPGGEWLPLAHAKNIKRTVEEDTKEVRRNYSRSTYASLLQKRDVKFSFDVEEWVIPNFDFDTLTATSTASRTYDGSVYWDATNSQYFIPNSALPPGFDGTKIVAVILYSRGYPADITPATSYTYDATTGLTVNGPEGYDIHLIYTADGNMVDLNKDSGEFELLFRVDAYSSDGSYHAINVHVPRAKLISSGDEADIMEGSTTASYEFLVLGGKYFVSYE